MYRSEYIYDSFWRRTYSIMKPGDSAEKVREKEKTKNEKNKQTKLTEEKIKERKMKTKAAKTV